MGERTTLEQLKDEFALWLLLYKLEQAGFQTQKLKLQKLMYLTDIFGTIFNQKPTNYTFLVYKHGPYTKEIQSDVEHLVVNGLVIAKEVERWDPSHERSFQYKIGQCNVEKANKVFDILDFGQVERAVDFVIQAAGYLNSKNIQALVYAEPNFIEAKELVEQKKRPFASAIDRDYTFVNKFRQITNEIYLDQYDILPSEEQVSWLYLNFVKSIQANKGNKICSGAADK